MSNLTKKIDEIVVSVIGAETLKGFEKAYNISNALIELEILLTPEYMQPIMKLQGTSLGFRTDKDGNGGYPENVVKKCLMEAVLKGYQPTNNEFNIIAGNMYPTKNGLERKANETKNLKYSIVQTIRLFDTQKQSALVDCQIKWNYKGEERMEVVPISLKLNAYTSIDAVQGKAKRKALAWLLSNVTGEIETDGEVENIPYVDVTEKTPEEDKRTLLFLESVIDLENFKKLRDNVPVEVYKRLQTQFLEKEQELLINQK